MKNLAKITSALTISMFLGGSLFAMQQFPTYSFDELEKQAPVALADVNAKITDQTHYINGLFVSLDATKAQVKELEDSLETAKRVLTFAINCGDEYTLAAAQGLMEKSLDDLAIGNAKHDQLASELGKANLVLNKSVQDLEDKITSLDKKTQA